jgi:alkanesulfonate monooxygenase SsuD/methylene tetrahydromethanopterin reductase-like flavin-dependent oxidoreductase (luciferase family)
VFCGETEEKARQMQALMEHRMLRLEQGIIEGFGPYEEIQGYVYSAEEQARIEHNRQRMISGTPERVKQKLTLLAEQYEVDEIVAVTITFDFADRIRSYELLAEAFELNTAEEGIRMDAR